MGLVQVYRNNHYTYSDDALTFGMESCYSYGRKPKWPSRHFVDEAVRNDDCRIYGTLSTTLGYLTQYLILLTKDNYKCYIASQPEVLVI